MTRVRSREYHFPLGVGWIDERRVSARVAGKHDMLVAPPAEFRGTDPTLWSPEDLLVGASATCLAVTFTGLAQRHELQISRLDVSGEGIVGAREDGRFGFTRIRLRLEVESSDDELARRLAAEAEADCLVSASLALPVEVEFAPS